MRKNYAHGVRTIRGGQRKYQCTLCNEVHEDPEVAKSCSEECYRRIIGEIGLFPGIPDFFLTNGPHQLVLHITGINKAGYFRYVCLVSGTDQIHYYSYPKMLRFLKAGKINYLPGQDSGISFDPFLTGVPIAELQVFHEQKLGWGRFTGIKRQLNPMHSNSVEWLLMVNDRMPIWIGPQELKWIFYPRPSRYLSGNLVRINCDRNQYPIIEHMQGVHLIGSPDPLYRINIRGDADTIVPESMLSPM